MSVRTNLFLSTVSNFMKQRPAPVILHPPLMTWDEPHKHYSTDWSTINHQYPPAQLLHHINMSSSSCQLYWTLVRRTCQLMNTCSMPAKFIYVNKLIIDYWLIDLTWWEVSPSPCFLWSKQCGEEWDCDDCEHWCSFQHQSTTSVCDSYYPW